MRVLMFGWEFPPNISGGLGTASYGLAKGLLSYQDISIAFVVPKAFGNELNPGIKLIDAESVELSRDLLAKQRRRYHRTMTSLNKNISGYITPEIYERMLTEELRMTGRTGGTLRSIHKFSGQYGASLFDEVWWYGLIGSEIARSEEHDIIHSHDWLTYEAGIEAKKRSGKPLVVHVHATEFDRSGENHNSHVYEIERKGMSQADMVITVSELTRNIVISKYKIDPLKVVTVHNGVEPIMPGSIESKLERHVDDHIVTFLGRITWQKGPEYFVKAAYNVLQRMKNVRFVMAGTGDLRENIIKYAAKLQIADRFHFTGFLKGRDVYDLLSVSDLYILPSVSEPFGISVLEAIQSNVPVIVSRQSGVSEVIRHAIKADFWDTDAMADAIYGVLTYPVLADHMRTNSIREAEKLTWQEAASRIRQIYFQLPYRKAG